MLETDYKQKAAIMFTDIANFTHSMSVDEKQSLSFLERKKTTLNSLVKTYKGKYVKDIGDGTLTYFNTANAALDCALELHYALGDLNNMDIRVGLHYGDIITLDKDIYGDDVNIASRLENLSPAGGICISSIFFDQLTDKNKIKTDYIGLQSFKGVGRLIDVYAINDRKLKKPNAKDYINENIIIDYEKVPSLTLFPFKNKGKRSDKFFAYSMSIDIITELSSTNKIKLTSIGELDPFKKRNYKNSTICKKLGTRYYIAGDFWKKDEQFNLSIELYDSHSDSIIWSDNWMEKWENLPSIKNKLINNIFRLLSSDYKDKNNLKDSQNNSEAYQLYLQAKYIFDSRASDKDFITIENLLNRAIQIDSQFINPYISFGNYYLAKNEYSNSLKYFELGLDISLKNKDYKNIALSLNGIGKNYYLNGKFEKALEHYNKSLQIWIKINHYTGIADTFNLIGSIHDYNGRHKEALKYYEKSYSEFLNANDKAGMCKTSFNVANINCTMGNMDNALKFQEISFTLSIDINNSVMQAYNYNLRGIIYSNTYKSQEAYKLFKQSLKIRKALNDKEGIATLYRNIGVVYLQMGLLKQSIDYFNKSLTICNKIGYYLGVLDCYEQLGKAYKTMGVYSRSIKYYKKALNILTETENADRLATVINKIGNLHIKMSQYKNALDCFKQSKKIKQRINDKLGIAFTCLGEAKVNYWLGDYSMATTLLKKCKKDAKKFNNEILIGDSNYFLSQIDLSKNNYNNAMNFINKAIKHVDKCSTLKSRLARYYDCKGLIYRFMGNLNDAIFMHEKALDISKTINDKHGLRKYLNNIALIYEEQGSFEQAMDIYAKCLKISKQMDEKRSICVSYCNIGYILEYQGVLNQSLKYFKRAHTLATNINYKAGIGGYSNNMAQIYIKKEQYTKALPLLDNAIKILNSLDAVDYIISFIAKVYCCIHLKNNQNVKKSILKIESLLKDNITYNDYRSLWQLSEIYKAQKNYKQSKIHLKTSQKLLYKRADKIKNLIDKNNFLNTHDVQIILLNIK